MKTLCLTVLPKILPFTFGESPMFAGQAAQVTCLVSEGDSPLDISWGFSKGSDFDDLGILVNKVGKKGSTLFIESISSRHQGNYTCFAKNPAGVVTYSAHLEIHGNIPSLRVWTLLNFPVQHAEPQFCFKYLYRKIALSISFIFIL